MRMWIVVLLGALPLAPAHAQGLEFGARAGVTVSNVSLGGEHGRAAFERRWGAAGGVYAVVPLWRVVRFQPELLLTQKGARLDAFGVESSLALDALEVPLLARVAPGALGGRVYVAAGPSFAYLWRAKTRTTFGDAIEEFDAIDDFERVDVGIVAAVGYQMRRFVVDARYTHGLADVDRDESAVMKTRTWSFTGGVRF